MSCLKHEPSEDSDASERPARPPKPARLSPAPLCEYVDVELKPPQRRTRADTRADARCQEYELMANFMSHARAADAPPAVPPRSNAARVRPQPKPADPDVSKSDEHATFRRETMCGSTASLPEGTRSEERRTTAEPGESRPASKLDTVSNDDSLLDELQRDTYCVLKVCEDESPERESADGEHEEAPEVKEKEEYGVFSRISLQRKSNPIKTQSGSMKPLKTSNSTSNVHDAGSHSSRPLAERLTLFLKKKPKPAEDAQSSKSTKREDNLIGRLTPRFGQSRLYGRGQSLELAQPESRTKRIERSATTVNIPTRPINSSIVANLKFLTLHRYGAQDDVQCRAFVQNAEEEGAASAEGEDGSWRRTRGALLAATTDIRL